jgi:intracellular sulfur oxidation DsrE/DsrF family protein
VHWRRVAQPYASSHNCLGIKHLTKGIVTTRYARKFAPIAFAAVLSVWWLAAGAEDKVVYHVNLGLEQASDALRNIRNHLEVNPSAKIVVVTHSRGVDFLMNDAQDKNKNPYNIPVEELKARGVTFDVCEITLRTRKLSKSQFIPEVTFVPSGVAEVTRLQQQEGYA